MSYINKITPPKHAVLDLDSALFLAASAAEQVKYTYKDVNGVLVAEFDSASSGANWLTEMEIFGVDARFGYTGDVDKLTREVSYKVGSEKKAFDAFDTVLNSWLSHTPIEKWTGRVAAMAGKEVFRHKIATIKPYKGGRDGRKPHHLTSVRKYSMQNPNIKRVNGDVEVDDVVLALAEKTGGVLIALDKDSANLLNGWYLNPDSGLLLYSDPKSMGWIERRGKDKMIGVGWQHFLYQCIRGDNVDGVTGIPRKGVSAAWDILERFNNKPVSVLPEAIKTVAEAYREYYGDGYTYHHWLTGEELTRSWKEIMIENIRLLWMKRNKDDQAKMVTQYLEGL